VGYLWEGEANGGDEGEGTWWMDFIYYMKQNKETSCNCFEWGGEGVKGERPWGDLTNVPYKPIWNCHNESPLYNEYVLIKNINGNKE
jgi:hypothetical protein